MSDEDRAAPATLDVPGPASMLLVCDCGQFMVGAGCGVMGVEKNGQPINVPTLHFACPECGQGVAVFRADGGTH